MITIPQTAHRKGSFVTLGAALMAATSLAAFGAADASACGGFFTVRVLESERRPSLAYEQTLIVFDAEKHREHFVREVVFSTSKEHFGFVVPTPAQPEVAKVATSPFAKLRESFPFRRPPPPPRAMPSKGGGLEVSAAAAPPPVQVLEVTKVGSFTAFVLAATDARALSKWLSDNGLVSTPEADTWLAHYVALKFFYVAMRYDPPQGESRKTAAETVRISFDSPVPYYPYLEPEKPKGDVAKDPRMLEIWLASTVKYVPVGLRRANGKAAWVRPVLDGDVHGSARIGLEVAVEPALLPTGELHVQRFADQKRSRSGFGDIVFVPEKPVPVDEAMQEKLKAFMPLLDPSLGKVP